MARILPRRVFPGYLWVCMDCVFVIAEYGRSEVEMRFPAVIKVYLRLRIINTSQLLGRFFRANGIHPSLSTTCHKSKHKPKHLKMNPRSLTTAVRSFTRSVPLRPALPAVRTFAPQLQARAYSEEKEFHEKEDKRIADLEAAKAESEKKAAEFEEKVKELTVSHHFSSPYRSVQGLSHDLCN